MLYVYTILISALIGFPIGFLLARVEYEYKCRKVARAKLDILRREDCWRLENWGKWDDSNSVHVYVQLIISLNYHTVPPDCLDSVTTKIKPASIGSSIEELERIRKRVRKYTVEALIDSARKHLEIVNVELLRHWLDEAGYSFSDIGVTEEELIDLNRQTRVHQIRKN